MTQRSSHFRYMEDVPALLSHCFGKKSVSREFKCLLYNMKQVCDCISFAHIRVCVCAGAFQTYLTAVMTLQYSEPPDYSALKAGLSAALLQLGTSMEQPLSF